MTMIMNLDIYEYFNVILYNRISHTEKQLS